MPFVFCFRWDQFGRKRSVTMAAAPLSLYRDAPMCAHSIGRVSKETCRRRAERKTQNALAHFARRAPHELFIVLDLSTTLYFYSCHFDIEHQPLQAK
jgi:hypothetical protein